METGLICFVQLCIAQEDDKRDEDQERDRDGKKVADLGNFDDLANDNRSNRN
ncbi:MAG: hypothetical protein M3Z08_16305 [Chloroflexota bacterium]|nr:hypothetical protein [Chloroflexota bacterium]